MFLISNSLFSSDFICLVPYSPITCFVSATTALQKKVFELWISLISYYLYTYFILTKLNLLTEWKQYKAFDIIVCRMFLGNYIQICCMFCVQHCMNKNLTVRGLESAAVTGKWSEVIAWPHRPPINKAI